MRSGPNWRTIALLAAIVVVGGVVRFEVARRALPISLIGDEVHYAQVAVSLAETGEHEASLGERALRPPLHPWVLSRGLDDSTRRRGPDAMARRLLDVQLLLGTLLVPLVFWLGRTFFDDRVGLVAAGVAALHPNSIAYSHYLWSETLFALLVGSACIVGVLAGRRASWALTALAGVLFGLAGLTREVALGIAGVMALWWFAAAPVGGRRIVFSRGALLMVCAACVVLPWTWRNYQVLGEFVPVGTVGWYAMAEGNLLSPTDWWDPLPERALDFRRQYFSIPDEMDRAALARSTALSAIAAAQPAWLFQKTLRNGSLLVQPDTFIAKKIVRGGYGAISRGGARWVVGIAVVFETLLLILALLGWAASPDRELRRLTLAVGVVVVVLHVLANATSRFRFPFMPFAMVYASWALLQGRALREGLSGRRAIAVVVGLLFFAGVSLPHFAEVSWAARAWSGPTSESPR